jgi:hypothetical protein
MRTPRADRPGCRMPVITCVRSGMRLAAQNCWAPGRRVSAASTSTGCRSPTAACTSKGCRSPTTISRRWRLFTAMHHHSASTGMTQVSGLWGVLGEPPSPRIQEGFPFAGALSLDASAGASGVFINEREIGDRELACLSDALGIVDAGWYALDARRAQETYSPLWVVAVQGRRFPKSIGLRSESTHRNIRERNW